MSLKAHLEQRVVVSLNIGASSSGFCVFFMSEQKFHFGEGEQPTKKSCLLLDHDMTFRAFGMTALEEYQKLTADEKQKVFFFDDFVGSNRLTEQTKFSDKTGKALDASVVYVKILEHLKSLALEEIVNHKNWHDDESRATIPKLVGWVVCIPSSWSYSARTFMQKVAEGAGLTRQSGACQKQDTVRIVLQSEAAIKLFLNKMLDQDLSITVDGEIHFHPEESGSEPLKAKSGDSLMLMDLGFHRVNLTSFQILGSNGLKELSVDSLNVGRKQVEEKFKNYLSDKFFTPEVLEEYEHRYPRLYRDLMGNISMFATDISKKCFEIKLTGKILNLYHERTGNYLEKVLPSSCYKNGIVYVRQRYTLNIPVPDVEEMFDEILKSISSKCEEILNLEHPSVLLLSGEFSKIPYVREKLTTELRGTQIKVANTDNGARDVLKGAALMALKPTVIEKRRASFAYGFQESVPFDREKHSRMRNVDGANVVPNSFHTLVKKGDDVDILSETQKFTAKKTFKAEHWKHKDVHFYLWRTADRDPKYCRTDTCTHVGIVHVPTPSEGWPDEKHWEWTFTIHENEIIFTVEDNDTKQQWKNIVEFQ